MDDIKKGWECELFEDRIDTELDEFIGICGKEERKEAVNIRQGYLLCEIDAKFKNGEITSEECVDLKKTLRRKAREIINEKA